MSRDVDGVASRTPKNIEHQQCRLVAKQFATLITDECEEKDIKPEDVIKLTMKFLGLNKTFPMCQHTHVNKLLPFPLCLIVWEYWDKVSDDPTMTTALALLRVSQNQCVKRTSTLHHQFMLL